MATLNRTLALVGLALFGCGKTVGLNAPVTPLVQFQVQVTGDIASVQRPDTVGQPTNLRVALVWGAQWLPEPFCVLPAEPGAAAVIAAGCPDSFRFVPVRAGAETSVEPGVPATIDLITLPSGDLMVGDPTARVAYASLIVYDDRNGNGTLDFHHPARRRHHGDQQPVEDAGAPATRDIVYGASFISMTRPDQRVAFREGAFNDSVAFYPRVGCDPPLPSFSILSAGGFSPAAALLAVLQGQLPAEDPATCGVAPLADAVITIPLQNPAGLTELACTSNDSGGTTYYGEPPDPPPDLSQPAWACIGFPHIPGDDAGMASGQQLVVASAPGDPCQGALHYTLRGCDTDPACPKATWDVTATPPAWWPCSTTP